MMHLSTKKIISHTSAIETSPVDSNDSHSVFSAGNKTSKSSADSATKRITNSKSITVSSKYNKAIGKEETQSLKVTYGINTNV
jgi:hypothetical protein